MRHRSECQSQGDTMSSVLINARISPIIVDELDRIVGRMLFRDQIEAVNEALISLIRNYKAMKNVLMSSRDGDAL